MHRLRVFADLAAAIVFLICVYVFLLGNKVFEARFENDFFSWYFLAKGIFCSFALVIMARILEKCSG
jgi:cell shape-determining protein MreD